MEAKIDEFSGRLQQIAAAAKLLSHPARVAIIEYLDNQDSCVTSSLESVLPLSRGTVAQHVSALKEAGWIHGTTRGTKICYCLDYEKIATDAGDLTTFMQLHNRTNSQNCTS